jgi:FKBP-type peptidyl-prolyl cis-trans isomerase 2
MNKLIITFALVLFTSPIYAADPVVGPGKHVKMDYTLFVNNEQIETSVGQEPLEFNIGDQSIIPGLESQIMGMHIGEEKSITVASKDAYGEVDPKALKEFPKSTLPKEAEAKVGMVLQATAPDGEEFPAVISEIKEDKVILDFNHPLAGKELKFNVKVLAISDAPAEKPTEKSAEKSTEKPTAAKAAAPVTKAPEPATTTKK